MNQCNGCHVILPIRGEPPCGKVSSDHDCPCASPKHTTIGSGLGRLGCGKAQVWLSQSGPSIGDTMSDRVGVLSQAVKEPVFGSPGNGNGKAVSSIVPLVSTLNVSQDEVTRLLKCN